MGASGGDLDPVAIIPAPAGPDLAVLHHRVPVMIKPGDFERWLDCRAHDVDDVLALLTGNEAGEFAWHEVSTRVNKTANDDAQLVLPITAEESAAAQAERPTKKAARKAAESESDDGQGSLFLKRGVFRH